MMNGGLSLHLMNREAKETETIAIPTARYAFEFSLIGGMCFTGPKSRSPPSELVDGDALDALCLPNRRYQFRRHLAFGHDEQFGLLGRHGVTHTGFPDAVVA